MLNQISEGTCRPRTWVRITSAGRAALSAWRRGVTGDMTGALALAKPPNTHVPPLPKTSLGDTKIAEEAVLNALAGPLDVGIPTRRPSGITCPSGRRPRPAPRYPPSQHRR